MEKRYMEDSFIYLNQTKKYILRHLLSLVCVAIFQLLIEIAAFHVFEQSGTLEHTFSQYFIYFVTVPFCINAVTMLIGIILIKKFDYSAKSEWIVSAMSLVIISNIYFCHNVFDTLVILFILEIMRSATYGNKKLTIFFGVSVVISKIIIDILLYKEPLVHIYGTHLNSNVYSILNGIVFEVEIIYSIVVALVMIALIDRKNNINSISKDELTGIYNRKTIMGFLEWSLTEKNSGVVIIIDLDGFKAINDKFGHPFGDKVLRDSADIITNGFRHNDMVGRLGGDEFMVIAQGMPVDVAIQKCESLIENLKRTYTYDDSEDVQIGASIGLAHFPTQGQIMAAIYDSADKALYQAKTSGKNKVCLHKG